MVLSSALGVPVWYTLPLVLPAAFVFGMVLQVVLLRRALRSGEIATVLVTFGLSVMIENLLQEGATANDRVLNTGAIGVAALRIGGQITLPWLFTAAFLTA